MKDNNKFSLKDGIQIVVIFAIAMAIYYALFAFVFSNDTVSGISVQPNFENGQRVIALRHAKIKTGEVVIVKAPDEPGAMYIKRVIGMPGQKLVSKNNKIYINGKQLKQPWLKKGFKMVDHEDGFNGTHYSQTQNFSISSLATTQNYQQFYTKAQLKEMQKTNRVPKGTYFVMGDHRSVSKDSRYIGTIKRKDIVGVVKLRYWPLNSWTVY